MALLFPIVTWAQDLKQANRDYAMLNYNEAILGYKNIVESSSKRKQEQVSIELLANLANSYYRIKEYDNAKKYYEQIYKDQGNNMNEELFMRMISTIRMANDLNRANELMKTYYAKDSNRSKILVFQKQKLDSLENEFTNLTNLSINSPKSDFGVAIKNGEAIFSSTRGSEKTEHAAYYNLYTATLNSSTGQMSNVKQYLSNLNSDYQDATLTFFNDYVFFSRNFLTKKEKLDAPNNGVSNVMIMRGKVDGNEIKDITSLDFNDKSYNCSHPYVSPDGKYLIFVSDKPGGFGQSDIYIADLNKDGSVGNPVNAGPMINTSGREMFPSISGDTLFFSSDFHYGFGGLDVFQSKMGGKTNFSVPENLGNVINSNTDDFAFVRLNNRTGYVSSDRKGGKGSDDIYWFDMVENLKYMEYSGTVLSKGDNQPIPNAKVEVFNQFNERVMGFATDDQGNFDAKLPLNSQLKLVYSKPEYSTESVSLSTPEKHTAKSGNKVHLTGFASLIVKEDNGLEKIKVEPIYFDYSKWDIKPQAEEELNKILFAMEKFPNIKIKIEAHTDSRGSDAFNLKLSDNRAKAAMTYLLSKGIAADRIESANGYGETRLKNQCKNNVKCSDEEHAVNRRSDFIIISK